MVGLTLSSVACVYTILPDTVKFDGFCGVFSILLLSQSTQNANYPQLALPVGSFFSPRSADLFV
jgi:hypothetical protein